MSEVAPRGSSNGRSLGLWGCVALVVGNMIGSGIFLLPATLAPYGSLSIFGWVVTSFGAILLALVFGRLAKARARTGGPYAYTRDGYGDFAGFIVAWGYWIALWSGNAAVAVAFVGYVAYFFPVFASSNAAGFALALAAIWLVTAVNIRGIRGAGNLQIITTALKILPLLLIIGLGFAHFDMGGITPLNPTNSSAFSGIVACSALTLWAFIGLESATVPAGSVINPSRTIPIATIVGVVFTAAIYMSVTIGAFSIMDPDALAYSTAPLADVATLKMGIIGGSIVAVGACISTFGTLNGFTLLSGQIPYGAAQDGVFPRWFDRISNHGVPVRSILVSNVLASLLIAMNFSKGLVDQFTFIILLATLATLIPYLFCALAEVMIWLRSDKSESTKPKATAIALGAIAFFYALFAVYGAGAEVVFFGFILLLLGIPIHVVIKWNLRSKNSKAT